MLYPVILIFCIVGAFAINNSIFDLKIMLAFGLLAYLMEVNGIPVAPAILGLVLGDLLENSFMISMMKSQWNLLMFFERPIAMGIGAIVILIWLTPLLMPLIRKKLASK